MRYASDGESRAQLFSVKFHQDLIRMIGFWFCIKIMTSSAWIKLIPWGSISIYYELFRYCACSAYQHMSWIRLWYGFKCIKQVVRLCQLLCRFRPWGSCLSSLALMSPVMNVERPLRYAWQEARPGFSSTMGSGGGRVQLWSPRAVLNFLDCLIQPFSVYSCEARR
jgi:hypothetical protein